jgi:hypothetical protein
VGMVLLQRNANITNGTPHKVCLTIAKLRLRSSVDGRGDHGCCLNECLLCEGGYSAWHMTPVEDHFHAMEARRRIRNSRPIPSSDAASIAARSAAHQQTMNVIYEEEAARLRDAWRHVT